MKKLKAFLFWEKQPFRHLQQFKSHPRIWLSEYKVPLIPSVSVSNQTNLILFLYLLTSVFRYMHFIISVYLICLTLEVIALAFLFEEIHHTLHYRVQVINVDNELVIDFSFMKCDYISIINMLNTWTLQFLNMKLVFNFKVFLLC